MRVCIFSDIVLTDTEDGHIKLSKMILDALVISLENNNLPLADFIHGVSQLDQVIRPMHGAFHKIPDALGGLILRWACDDLFSLPVLALGSFCSILTNEQKNRLNNAGITNEIIDQFLRVLPWMTSELYPLKHIDNFATRIYGWEDYSPRHLDIVHLAAHYRTLDQ